MNMMETTKQFTDNNNGSIYYSGIEGLFIGTPAFNRLHNVLQSSLAYLTYPTNKVKRFEHSVGTMKMAGDIFYHSICNTVDSRIFAEFFNKVENDIFEWLNKESNLRFANADVFRTQNTEDIKNWIIPNPVMYNLYTPANIGEYRNIYLIVFQSIRLAGLLHDIGHLPFSHILENFLKSIYNELSLKVDKNDREEEFITSITPYYNMNSLNSKIEIHEGVGIKLFEHILDNISSVKTDISNPRWMFLDVVCYVTKRILSSDNIDGFSIYKDLHLIVSGVLDADRLDYCNRDLYGAGIYYTPSNNNRIFSGYKIIRVEEKMQVRNQSGEKPEVQSGYRFFFSPDVKHITEIENLIDLRWKDFSLINFHHRVHKHEILLEEVLKILALDYFKSEEKSGDSFGAKVSVLPLEISSIWKLLLALNRNAKIEHLLIQLDDNWLNTLLKQEFFKKYGNSYMKNNYANDANWNIYHELISAQRHYYSLIKREDDFRLIDNRIFDLIKERIESDNISETNAFHYMYKDLLLRFINTNYYEFVKERGFVFNYIIGSINSVFTEQLLSKIEIKLKKELVSENIRDIIIRKCQFGLGYSIVKEPVYVHSKNDYYRIEQRSRQLGELQQRQSHSPYFHIYYLPTYDHGNCHYNSVEKSRIYSIIQQIIFELVSSELFLKKQ